MAAELADWEAEEFYHASQEAGITNSYVTTPADLYDNDHLAFREFFADVPVPHGDPVSMPTDPYAFSRSSREFDRAPRLGSGQGCRHAAADI